MGLFDSRTVMWVGFVLLLVAAVLAVVAATPRRNELPMTRRRPDVPPPPGPLSRFTTAATNGAGRVIAGRGNDLDEALGLAGIRAQGRDVVVLLGSAMVVLLALGLVAVNFLVGLLLALLVPIGFWLVVRMRTSKRRSDFGEQLSDVLQMLASGLRAGSSLPQAMQMVASEGEEPTRTEFIRVSNELRVGRPIGDTLDGVSTRMQSQDFSWIAQAVAINREVGGNLADVLDGVANTMRERAALRRQVRALSAEGRMSGWILMLLPVGVSSSCLSPTRRTSPRCCTPRSGWVLHRPRGPAHARGRRVDERHDQDQVLGRVYADHHRDPPRRRLPRASVCSPTCRWPGATPSRARALDNLNHGFQQRATANATPQGLAGVDAVVAAPPMAAIGRADPPRPVALPGGPPRQVAAGTGGVGQAAAHGGGGGAGGLVLPRSSLGCRLPARRIPGRARLRRARTPADEHRDGTTGGDHQRVGRHPRPDEHRRRGRPRFRGGPGAGRAQQ